MAQRDQIVVAMLLLIGCASPSASVAVKPMAGQDAARLASDSAACERWAGTQDKEPTSYSACMMFRSYRATVDLEGHFVEMTGPPGRDPAAMVTQIRECRDVARDKRGSAGRGPAILIGVATGAAFGASYYAGLLEEPFAACMTPLGYTVERWVPASTCRTGRC